MPETAPPPTSASAPSPSGVVLVSASRFFVRRIPLVPGQDAGTQAELALETIGPFAPAQLYHGLHVLPGGAEALVFAAYRRNFAAAESAAWAAAEAVLPTFAFWLGQPAPAAPEIWLHATEEGLTALWWDGQSPIPAGVLARAPGDQADPVVREELIGEARRRLGAPEALVRDFEGLPVAQAPTKQGLTLALGERTSVFTPAQVRGMDVRDKAELAQRQVRSRRDRRLWAVFAATAAVLGLCVAAEAGMLVSRGLLSRQRGLQEAAGAEVRRIEQASRLVARMERLAGQSLRPFEMLAAVNALRPPNVEFVRAGTAGPLQLDIEAQTANASDPQAYEQALRAAPAVERVELRDLRTSGGRTTFLVVVVFKPGFAGGAGAP